MTPSGNTLAGDKVWLKRPDLLVRTIAVIAALSFWPVSVYAQVNPFRGYKGPVLTKTDIEQGMQAADRLLKDHEAKVGASETWTGPATGNSGTLTVQKAYERNGRTCRSLQSAVHYKAGTKRTWTVNVCRLANGDWKTV